MISKLIADIIYWISICFRSDCQIMQKNNEFNPNIIFIQMVMIFAYLFQSVCYISFGS